MTLTPAESIRFLTVLHAERCPAIAGAPAPSAVSTVQSAPHPPRSNLIVRNVRRLFGRDEKPVGAPTTPETRNSKPETAAAVGAASAKAGTAAAPAVALTAEEMRAQILNTLTPAATDFTALAAHRAQRIQEYLLTKGQVEPARVFLATGGVPPAAGAGTVPRVVFNLQ